MSYPILYFYGPRVFDENAEKTVQHIKDAGFTRMQAEIGDVAQKKRIIALAETYGLEVTVQDARIEQAKDNAGQRRELLAQVVADYKDCPNVVAYDFGDEPNAAAFETWGATSALLKQLDPAREVYVNLYPNYANAQQLGNGSYEEHLREFSETVKPEILSYDHYHFGGRGWKFQSIEGESDRDRFIRENAFSTKLGNKFFENLEQVRNESLRTGVPFMVIVLLAEHGNYRCLSEAEIRWEAFQCLAYGSNRISYFTYGNYLEDPNDNLWKNRNACVNYDNTRNRHWFDVRRVNEDLQVLGSYLQGKANTGVFHWGECKDKLVSFYEPGGDISKIQSQAGLTLGFFAGGEILLANKDYETVNHTELTLVNDKHLEIYDKHSAEWYAILPKINTIDVFPFVLAPGDAELIRIR
ncbi:MAG: hypothetical protein LBS96_00240 [Oscillospiraceae bacterium]|jgi:hypothetical protein|nr:hypothetical protein [Oscillospiraceae bacterium]